MTKINDILLTGKDARTALMTGIDIIADTVGVSFGPRKRAILQLHAQDTSIITFDGVTIARSIPKLPDPFEDRGAEFVRRTCAATVIQCGDGTSTAAILIQAMFRHGLVLLAHPGILRSWWRAILAMFRPAPKLLDAVTLRKEIETALDIAETKLRAMTKPADLMSVALTSLNGDEALAKLATYAVDVTGQAGYVDVRGGAPFESHVDRWDGPRVAMPTRTPQLQRPSGNVRIAFARSALIHFDDLRPFLSADGTPLVDVIAGQVTHIALAAALKFGIFVVDLNPDDMADIAALLGATIVDASAGHTVGQLPPNAIVQCQLDDADDLIEVSTHTPANVDQYAQTLPVKRRAALTGKRATIRLNLDAQSAAYVEAFEHLDDALHACRSALTGEVVPGAGRALYDLSELPELAVIAPVLRTPREKLLASGVDPDATATDPVNVVIASLRNALTNAALLLTVDRIVLDPKLNR